jgi:SprT-like family
MLTDSPPRKNRTGFLESDRIKTLDLPPNGNLLDIAKRLESAMKSDSIHDVRTACAGFLATASDFYRVPPSGIRVLAARPLRVREGWSTELFGDYHPQTMLIRVWMRTAVRKEVTSFGTFLSTLCHELCHHLDFQLFRFRDSWHTRGFYERAAALYHHARGTLQKRLFWVPMGGQWRIDWQRTNRGA